MTNDQVFNQNGIVHEEEKGELHMEKTDLERIEELTKDIQECQRIVRDDQVGKEAREAARHSIYKKYAEINALRKKLKTE